MNTANLERRSVFFTLKLTFRQFSTKSKIVGATLLLVGLVGLGWRLPHLLAKPQALAASPALTTPLLPVETVTAEALPAYQTTRAYTGQITARRSSDLGFERPGKLVSLEVEEGTRVTPDTLLAHLDTRELRTAQHALQAERAQATARLAEMRAGPRAETIAAARAERQERRAELSLAQSRRTRRQRLWSKGVVAREEFDAADAELKTWQARLDASQRRLDELLAGTRREQIRAQEALVAQLDAQLATVALDLDQSVLKAPFTGTIAARLVDEGTVVGAGQALLRLVEDTHPEVRAGVPPDVAAALPLGSQHPVRVGATRHTAQVTALLPELDTATRTVTVVLTLQPIPAATVLPGQTARLHVEETVQTAGFWLPTTALTKGERGLWSCLALAPDADDKPERWRTERRAVEILHTDNSRVFVRGLLQTGDRVVKNGTHRIVAGQRVTPLPSQPLHSWTQ